MPKIVRVENARLINKQGKSENWGIDVGSYPMHHFVYRQRPSTDPLGAFAAGDDEWVAGCFRQRYASELCALELISDGSMRVSLNNEERLLTRDDGFLIHPGDDCSMICGPAGYCRKHTIIFDGPLLGPLLTTSGLDRVRFFTTDDGLGLRRRVATIAEHIDDDDCSSRAYDTLLALARAQAVKPLPPALSQAMAVIDRQLQQPLSLSALAATCGVSVSTLNRLFKQELATTAIAYQRERRLQASAERLRHGEERIAAVARAFGWDDQLRFSTVFKQRFGMSPSRWRTTVATGADGR